MKSLSLLIIALALGSGFCSEGDRPPERGEGRYQESKPSFVIHDKAASAKNAIRRTKPTVNA
jgi:hypothetical protein